MLFSFRKTNQPTAGAEAWSFYTGIMNPQFPLFKGPGVQYLGVINALQPAPLYYPNVLTTTSGLGGLIAGTLYGQPLYVPPSMLPRQ